MMLFKEIILKCTVIFTRLLLALAFILLYGMTDPTEPSTHSRYEPDNQSIQLSAIFSRKNARLAVIDHQFVETGDRLNNGLKILKIGHNTVELISPTKKNIVISLPASIREGKGQHGTE